MRLLTLLLLLIGGCTYTPAFNDLTCDSEGETRDGRRCANGVWVTADAGVTAGSDMDSGGATDVGSVADAGADLGTDAGTDPDVSCSAESDTFFCERLGRTCEMVTASDNCSDERTVDCGSCNADIEQCVDNVCELIPESDLELCAAAGATCDEITVEDRTGTARTVNCGSCTAPLTCGAGGTANTCACANADDVQFCLDNGANCGPVTAMDPICNIERTVNCGTCAAPETCGGGGTASVCGCTESDAEFCARLGKNCGSVTDTDLCGVARTATCGTCADPQTCGAAMPNVCGCDVATVCAASNAQCGSLNVSNRCDNISTADCGGCGGGTCNQQANTCSCDPGYTFNGTTCADDDECTSGNNNCDPNAACANTPGGFTCTCQPPYAGNGQTCALPDPPMVEEIVTDTTPAFDPATGEMTGVDDQLYVAFISIRGSGSVNSVSGLGLSWSRVTEHCSGDDRQQLEVWTARGDTSGNSNITASLGLHWAATMVVYRISGVPASGTAGAAVIYNSNGEQGACDDDNAEDAYSFSYTPQSSNSLLLAAAAIEDANHSPGSGWTEDEELHRTNSSRDSGIATMQRTNSATSAVTVNGTLDQSENWAATVFEVFGL